MSEPWSPLAPPADEVLLELGRLVWAAIELEGVVYTVCRCVKPRHGPNDDHPIGDRIAEARRDLEERPLDDLRRHADRWLVDAGQALEVRNTIIHSVPGTLYARLEDVREGKGRPVLSHVPRQRRKPPVQTPFTPEALAEVTAKLRAAKDGWVDLATELWERRPRPSAE